MRRSQWTEALASETRRRLGIQSFASAADVERLLGYAMERGLQVREDREIDCLAEIRKFRGRWKMKLFPLADRDRRAAVILHEIGHSYTRSGMTAICSPCFAGWWLARDELYATAWCAYFWLPADPLRRLVRQGATWHDLLLETGAPEGLLAFRLRGLRLPARFPPVIPEEPELVLPEMASSEWKLIHFQACGWQHHVGIRHRRTGEIWIYQRRQDARLLAPYEEELQWALTGSSVARFWEQWRPRLEPFLQGLCRYAAPTLTDCRGNTCPALD